MDYRIQQDFHSGPYKQEGNTCYQAPKCITQEQMSPICITGSPRLVYFAPKWAQDVQVTGSAYLRRWDDFAGMTTFRLAKYSCSEINSILLGFFS